MTLCEKCNGKTRIMVRLIVNAPSEMAYKFTKGNIAKKEFVILGADWDQAYYICESCGWIMSTRVRN